MGRRKIEIRAIKDDRNRSVTFLKRKGGLFKKAHELSVLCSVDVAVIIFGHNKKLYEFSSGDIQETLRRYQYYGQAHEHKGPNDFKGKSGGGDDEEDEDEDEEMAPMREDSMPPQHSQALPPHLQHHNSYMRQPAASASPPMPNGMFQPRHSTPQPPHMGSRPSSRETIRRTSSNLIPMQHHPTPPPPQNGYAYAPNPPIYNPNAGPPPHPSPQPQYQAFPPHAPQPAPPASHQQMQQAHQQYMQDQRRMSQPQNGLQPPPPQPAPRASPQPEQPHTLRPAETISPPQPKHLSSKSRSIFTPIDDGGSVLAQFFSAPDPSRRQVKREGSPDIKPPPRAAHAPRSAPQQHRTQSQTSDFAPPSRSDTSGSKSGARPKLNLQIPSEASDNDSVTGSPHQSGGGVSANPARGGPESHPSGLVLPPPSPSASAVLSAGASGPPNPFARPPPPTSSAQNANAYLENRTTVETPMSALPSRFIADNLLPSPGGFYSDWDYGKGSLNSAVLPSPLGFPTPVNAGGPSFTRGETDAAGEKRKGSEERMGEAKKLKA